MPDYSDIAAGVGAPSQAPPGLMSQNLGDVVDSVGGADDVAGPSLFGAMSIGSSIGGAIGSVVGGFAQAGVIKAQAEIVQQRAAFNAKMTNIRADQTIASGTAAATEYMKQVNQLVGRQRSTYAAQGVKVGSGVARQAEGTTRARALESVLNIKANAWNAAYGLRAQAGEQMAQSSFATAAAGVQGTGTILSGVDVGTKRLFKAVDTARKV